MLILPAIDLRGGQCVRLRQGDYAQETVFGADPAAMAKRWVDEGAQFLHLVDLDGAREGKPVNTDSVRAIVKAAGVPCQLGGGMRTEAHIEQTLGLGVSRVVVGTKAITDPGWLERVCNRFPGKVVLGIDARQGRVATEGWLQESSLSPIELAKRCEAWPLAALVYTDIGRDGMMQGPNLDAMRELGQAVKIPLIASGGVTTIEDVRRLATLGIAGAIIGRALYEGTIDLAEALAVAR